MTTVAVMTAAKTMMMRESRRELRMPRPPYHAIRVQPR